MDCPCLLQVVVEAVEDRVLLAGREVADKQNGIQTDAAHERESLAVMRGSRPDRAARTPDDVFDIARRAIQAADRIDARIRIFVVLEEWPGRGVLAEVDVLSIPRKDRLADVLLIVRLLRHLDTRAAGDVIQPHLAGPNRPRAAEVLVRGDELPVRRPRGAVQQSEVFFGDLGSPLSRRDS